MKAHVIKCYGKAKELQLTEVAVPTPKDHEVLVEVHAAGLNPLDAKIRNGEFKLILPYKPPFILGHELAGVVTQVGAHVTKFRVGDEVYARPSDFHIGTLAKYIAVHEDDAALKPKNLTMQEAASIPLVGLTAWQALIDKANLKNGQDVFIQAGSGGVGTFAIQLAKYLGATVATTTSAANADWVKKLGADRVIDYRSEDFEKVLKDYDVVLHSQNNQALEKSLRILKTGGHLVSISGPPDPNFATELALAWPLKMIMAALSHRARALACKLKVNFAFLFMKANGKQLAEITKLLESRAIRPVVDRVFSFDAANEALRYVESGRAKGKVVVTVKES